MNDDRFGTFGNASVSNDDSVFLGIGGNLGDRVAHLRHALWLLAQDCDDLTISPVYETPPWGDTDQPMFLNLVARGKTVLSPQLLLARVKAIEFEVGRRPTRRWGPRVIDIDILAMGRTIENGPDLAIPHALMHERGFVMVPLADLEPEWVHPVLGTSASLIAASLPDDARLGMKRTPIEIVWEVGR
ncbi:MAG: hypothetical protein RL022_833 [Chloroflexota bacterium]|jgi:2-amino-4-hydroxy-6-hydroxymethyldihydropteridine diphosphokinase